MDFNPEQNAPPSPATNSVSQQDFDRVQKFFFAIASGIMIVLFIGLIGVLLAAASMVMDSNVSKQGSYNSL